jgi:hypothetical protein
MATETDFPHPKSAREIREAGWALSKAGKPQAGMALLKQARRMEAKEAQRVRDLKADADAAAAIKRND